MRILIKLGGTLLDSDDSRRRLASEIAALCRTHSVVVVHGGGKQMTRFLSERGVESRFVEGLRVTTPEVLDAVLKVLAGTVNKQLVSALIEAGARAVGISGIDGCLTEAETLRPELGAVGRPMRTNPAVLNALGGAGFVPVVACVAGDCQGRMFNVNADQMAVSCAAGFGAERLLFLTDVEGVRGAGGAVLGSLTAGDCIRLVRDGTATGGMQAKLNAGVQALEQGVDEVVILPGYEPEILDRALRGEPLGTRLIPEEVRR